MARRPLPRAPSGPEHLSPWCGHGSWSACPPIRPVHRRPGPISRPCAAVVACPGAASARRRNTPCGARRPRRGTQPRGHRAGRRSPTAWPWSGAGPRLPSSARGRPGRARPDRRPGPRSGGCGHDRSAGATDGRRRNVQAGHYRWHRQRLVGGADRSAVPHRRADPGGRRRTPLDWRRAPEAGPHSLHRGRPHPSDEHCCVERPHPTRSAHPCGSHRSCGSNSRTGTSRQRPPVVHRYRDHHSIPNGIPHPRDDPTNPRRNAPRPCPYARRSSRSARQQTARPRNPNAPPDAHSRRGEAGEIRQQASCESRRAGSRFRVVVRDDMGMGARTRTFGCTSRLGSGAGAPALASTPAA